MISLDISEAQNTQQKEMSEFNLLHNVGDVHLPCILTPKAVPQCLIREGVMTLVRFKQWSLAIMI